MKYQPPYGIADPDASYINGNPASGIEGSIPPAAAIEQPMREIVNVITASQFTPSDGDLAQLLRSIRRQFLNFCIDTGTLNSLVVTLNPPLEQYWQGMPLHVLIGITNTAACVINVNGLGNRAIKRPDGSDLHAGDMTAGMIANLLDTGTVYQLQNAMSGVAGTSNTYTVQIPYIADTGTVNTIKAIYSPALTAIVEGQYVAVKVAFTNTGAMTFQPNALPTLPVYRQDGQPLMANDIRLNETILLENHGTYYQVQTYVQSQFPAAPKLRGIIASQTGYGAQAIAAYVPNGVGMILNHTDQNSLQTSTFDGATLTVGAGEAGIWAVFASVHLAKIGVDCNYASVFIDLNNGIAALTSNGGNVAGSENALCVQDHIPCQVGDKLTFRVYHQAYGYATMYTVPDETTSMSAYLISTF
jgi:hypothetical protein